MTRPTLLDLGVCTHGHPIRGPEDLYQRGGNGGVRCKVCNNEYTRNLRARKNPKPTCFEHSWRGNTTRATCPTCAKESLRERQNERKRQSLARLRGRTVVPKKQRGCSPHGFFPAKACKPCNDDYQREYRIRKRAKISVEVTDIAAPNLLGLTLTPTQAEADRKFEEAQDVHGKGLCNDKPDEWIDPFDEVPATPEQAAAMCNGCPLLKECGILARSYKPELGVWAGESWFNGKVVR